MHPFIIHTVLISLMSTTLFSFAYGMDKEPVLKKHKSRAQQVVAVAAEEPIAQPNGFAPAMVLPPKMIKVTGDNECAMLMDALANGTKSKFYKTNRTVFDWENDQGTDPLERAIYRKDLQECINLVAQGHPVFYPLQHEWHLIHVAVCAGMRSFCEFLIQHKVNINGIGHTTPLDIAAERGHGKIAMLFLKHGARAATIHTDKTWHTFNHLSRCQDISLAELTTAVSILATQRAEASLMVSTAPLPIYRQAVNAPIFRDYQQEDLIFDSLALTSTPERFYEILPLLIKLDADLESPDEFGRKPLHRFFYTWDDTNISPETCTRALINIITAYHAFLERQELKAAFTALAIHKHCNGSLLAQLPKDVLKSCVLKFVVPFRVKHLEECVNQQLALMQRLLAIDTQHRCTQSASVAELTELSEKQRQIQAILDQSKVEQHRAALTATTHKLMHPNADPEINNPKNN